MENNNAKNYEYIWFNGSISKFDSLYISPLTNSLHYAGAVFEGQRAYKGKIFKLREHSQRLIDSAKGLGMKVNWSLDQLIEANCAVIEANNIQNAYIRPLVWRGNESLGILQEALLVNVMIVATPSKVKNEQELKLNVSQWRRIPPSSLDPQIKSSGHYNMSGYIKQIADSQGYNDSIMLDCNGNIAETTVSNIFFIKNNSLFTPPADYFLNGITRQTIIEIARKKQIPVIEKTISPNDLKEYDGCFLTGTSIEIQIVRSIDYMDNTILFEQNILAQDLKQEYLNLVNQ